MQLIQLVIKENAQLCESVAFTARDNGQHHHQAKQGLLLILIVMPCVSFTAAQTGHL
jgi:hypothetical protein